MDYSREMLCRLWLQNADAASWNAVKRLLCNYGSAEKVWDAFSPEMRKELSEKGYQQLLSFRNAGRDKQLMDLDRVGAQVIFDSMPVFSERLRNIPDAPDILFVRGKLPPEDCPAVAIVGSRHDTRYGREQATRIARELAQMGVVIVSGLARGIDTAAHEGALQGGGKTVAVLGNGIKGIYPPENRDLAERILQTGGAIISEFAPDSEPLPFHFPIRNRLISGLSDALLLIEARHRSGTASTVNHALNQGREVFALPGNVGAPGSELPLQLLKEGAMLCTEGMDIALHMGWKKVQPQQVLKQVTLFDEAAEGQEDSILRSLRLEEKTFEELLEETHLNASELGGRLTLLEIEGKVQRVGGRAYRKA
ncbi:MAG: DNA-processing protein DprA [Clostridia bacterium]|nr:DNA-processing protein DprA [Clostridia bacterium]